MFDGLNIIMGYQSFPVLLVKIDNHYKKYRILQDTWAVKKKPLS